MARLSKLEVIRQMLESAENNIISARELLKEIMGISGTPDLSKKAKDLSVSEDGKIIEGVFDGEDMVGPDSQKYPVPANYASKSKLVCGDVLKLTVASDGSYIYKQIGPVERKKVIGVLTQEDDKFKVLAEGRAYNVLQASITYFKAKPGDEVTLVLPKTEDSDWGAIENVILKPQEAKLEEKETKEKKEKKSSSATVLCHSAPRRREASEDKEKKK
jgi:hypothetical protein